MENTQREDTLSGTTPGRATPAGDRLARLLRRRSPIALVCAGVTLAMDAVLLLDAPAASELFTGLLVQAVHRGAVVTLAVLSLAMLATDSDRSLRVFVGLHILVTAFLVGLFDQNRGDLPLFLTANLLPLGVYLRYPGNLAAAFGFLAAALGILGLTARYPALDLVRAGLPAAVAAFCACLMGHYRESIIPLQKYVNRLEENVSVLTRANSLSQDYARDVEEDSRVAERQRLTRDIHDAVGYTLTNTIMAIEAAKMMVITEPQRVPNHLEAARKNAEAGLAQIKQMLRDFRKQSRATDSCFLALRKLVKVFCLSTGLKVRFELGNVDVAALDAYGECVYHFVQEGLINAFRHGRAERVTILMWDYGQTLRITLDDDGCGSPEEPQPGIGITGMTERAELVGGRVRVDSSARGFRISMILPKAAMHDES